MKAQFSPLQKCPSALCKMLREANSPRRTSIVHQNKRFVAERKQHNIRMFPDYHKLVVYHVFEEDDPSSVCIAEYIETDASSKK